MISNLISNMATFIGKLEPGEEGELVLKIQLTPQNPELYDVTFEELLEDFIGKKVKIDILPLVTPEEVPDL